jgi:hypothetical protein
MAATRGGHTVWTAAHPGSVKHWGECSCGYKSTWRATAESARAAALNHL